MGETYWAGRFGTTLRHSSGELTVMMLHRDAAPASTAVVLWVTNRIAVQLWGQTLNVGDIVRTFGFRTTEWRRLDG